MAIRRKIAVHLNLDGKNFKRGLARSKRDLKDFRQSANTQIRSVALAGAALTTGAILIGSSFEQSMANIQSVARPTEDQLDRLEKKARSLGSTTAYSATQSADAIFNLSLQGLSVEKSMDAAEASLKLAGSTMSGLEESAELVGVQLSIFEDRGTTAAQIANTMTRSTQLAALNFDRLRDSLQFAAPVAGQFNVTMEETVGSLALLAKQGRFGSIAGTGLASIMLELTTNTKKYADIIPEGTLQTRGLVGVLEELEKKAVPAEDIMGRLGKRAGPSMGILLKAGSDGLRRMTEELTGSNAAWEAYEIQQDTVRGAWKRTQSALEELGIASFQNIQKGLRNHLDSAARFINQNTASIAGWFGRVTGAIGTVLEKGIAFGRWVRSHDEQVRFFTVSLTALTVGLYSAATAQAAWNAVSKANPWLLLAVGVAALVGWVDLAAKRMGGWKVLWAELKGGARGFGEMIAFEFKKVELNARRVWDYLDRFRRTVFAVFESISIAVQDNWVKLFTGDFQTIASEALLVFREKYERIWDGFTETHDTAMVNVVVNHYKKLGEIEDETRAAVDRMNTKLSTLGEEPERIAHKGKVETPGLGAPVPGMLPAATESDDGGGSDVRFAINQALIADYQRTWDALIEIDMTGKERRESVWESMKTSLWGIMGEITRQWIWNQAKLLFSTESTESMMTAATVSNTGVRIAANSAQAASNEVVSTSATKAAAANFFMAHSWAPLIGFGLAAGFVASMVSVMRSFDVGGWVDRDQVARVHRDEFVVRRGPAQQYAPMLEAMNAGNLPRLSGAGAGGGNVIVNVQIASGSLFLADDDMAVRRFGEKIHDVIESKIKRTYRG